MRSVGLSKLFGFALVAAAVMGMASVQAAPTQNKAVVRGLAGTANYSNDKGANWKKLNVGTQLGQASIIRTAPQARVDLFLGDNGPVVRVTEDTTLGLDKLTYENMGQGETIIETQLDLRNGRILGHVKKLAQASKYEVKTPVGVAGIRGTQYDIRADGTVSVIEGTVVVVYIVGGVPSTATANTGETVRPPANPGDPVVAIPTPAAMLEDGRRQIRELIEIAGGPITPPIIIVVIDPVENPNDDPIDSNETIITTNL